MTFLGQEVKHVVSSVAPNCDDLARSVAKVDNWSAWKVWADVVTFFNRGDEEKLTF